MPANEAAPVLLDLGGRSSLINPVSHCDSAVPLVSKTPPSSVQAV